MKNVNLVVGLVAATFLSASGAFAAAVPGEYLVKFKPGAFLPVADLQQVSKDIYLVKEKSSLQSLTAMNSVDIVEPNYIVHAFDLDWALENRGQAACASGGPGLAGIDVKAVPAWGITKGNAQAIVAVIDTGVSETPRLDSSILVNEAESKGAEGVDDDGNGYVDDIRGYDFTVNRGEAVDENGHGTFVAGQIAASDAGDGVVGLAPNVKVLPIRFLDGGGAGSLANAIRSIDYAVSRGATVINASWGGGERSALLEEAIQRAQAKGVLVVAAAGNNGSDLGVNPSYPASFPASNIIAVAGVNNRGQLPYWSNYGQGVHITAPGSSIRGLMPDGRIECFSGTSMSTPYVAAAAALMQSVKPGTSAEVLKAKLMETVTPLPDLQGKTATGGMLNAFEALKSL